MAYENIDITSSNFCRGPQAGTICTLDTSSVQTVMHIKNTTGTSIMDLTFSSNIINSEVRVEYVGPYNLTTIVDNLTFFTFEKVSSTKCMIKRWETRVTFRELVLKEQIVKATTGNEYYDAIDFAIEYYHQTFTKPNEYFNYLDMSSVDNLKPGTKLFLGPSTDPDNFGATEVVTVNNIIEYIGGKRVYLTSKIKNQYVTGDVITFYCNAYIYSNIGYGGDLEKGTLYKIDAYSWITKEAHINSIYKKVTAAKWCPVISGIASIINTNMLIVRPYDDYQIWKSLFLRNIEEDDNTIFEVFDIIFDNYSFYKLQKKTTLKNDSGNKTTYTWKNYNFQADTLLPYTSSITTYTNKSILIGQGKTTLIKTQVRDQYHMSLQNVTINFFISGDAGARFTPFNGEVVTDTNGEAGLLYTSGTTYRGHTQITSKAVGSSSSTGSPYSWATTYIISYPLSSSFGMNLSKKASISGATKPKKVNFKYQIYDTYYDRYEDLSILLFKKSFFTSPGGDWGLYNMTTAIFYPPIVVEKWLPNLYRGAEKQLDGPRVVFTGTFEFYYFWDRLVPTITGSLCNRITQILDKTSTLNSKAVNVYYIYPSELVKKLPEVKITAPDESGKRYLSQINTSGHTYWVAGKPYKYAWTSLDIDQFIFVEDAVPAFYSEKNPTTTNVWLRLRPYALSLSLTSFRMWIREVSSFGDTGYYEVTDKVLLTAFNAGSNNYGLEVLYNPALDFKHGATVFVIISVSDIANPPNFIEIEYWFKTVPDYKVPYITNMHPSSEEIDVPVNTNIYFEVVDTGAGVNIDTLECLVNSRRVLPEDLNIVKVGSNHYKVTYNLTEDLYYNKDYKVTIKVSDLSEFENTIHTSYTFYTIASPGVVIQDPNPGYCKAGMDRFQTVSVKILADGTGVDADTIKMQVFDKDVDNIIKIPILYRVA